MSKIDRLKQRLAVIPKPKGFKGFLSDDIHTDDMGFADPDFAVKEHEGGQSYNQRIRDKRKIKPKKPLNRGNKFQIIKGLEGGGQGETVKDVMKGIPGSRVVGTAENVAVNNAPSKMSEVAFKSRRPADIKGYSKSYKKKELDKAAEKYGEYSKEFDEVYNKLYKHDPFKDPEKAHKPLFEEGGDIDTYDYESAATGEYIPPTQSPYYDVTLKKINTLVERGDIDEAKNIALQYIPNAQNMSEEQLDELLEHIVDTDIEDWGDEGIMSVSRKNAERFSKLKQRIAQVRLAATEQQTTEGGTAPERVKGRAKKVATTKQEVVNAMKEGKPMRTRTPLRHGERLPPTYRTDGNNFFLYGNKILSKQGNGYQTHVKDFINDDNYEQITLDTFRDFGIKVDAKGVIDSTKQFFTKDGLAMETKTNGDLTKNDMVIPANEITDGRVLVNKYKPPTGIKQDIYPYTPENLRNFAAESRRRATSMQVNSEGRTVPEGTLRGDPSAIRKRSLSETATQPEDAKTVNKMLGFPEEYGLEKTFGEKVKGKYKGIEGSKTHHTLFKKKFKGRAHPLARFKHTRNVKATPKGSFANPFANNPENAIQLSKPEHKELHRLNPHSNFRNIMESKLRMARLKIARIRQRNISRKVTQINMARDDSDPDRAWLEASGQLEKLVDTPGYEGNFTLHKGKLVNFEHEKDTLDLLDSVEGDQNYSMFSVSNTHDIVDRKDPQLKTKFNEFVKQGLKPTIGKWEGKFDATVNFRDKNRKQVEKIARGELNEFGKPIRAQQSYVETTEIPRKAPTGPRKFKTKFFNYNKETDTYEE